MHEDLLKKNLKRRRLKINNILYEACVASQTEWVESFESSREHIFSQRHEKRIRAMFSKIRNNKYRKITKNTVRFIIIAAILLSLTIITAFGIQAVFESGAYRMKDETLFKAQSSQEHSLKENLTTTYIPNGYSLKYFKTDSHYKVKYYSNTVEDYFMVEKSVLNSEVMFHSDGKLCDKISKNGIDYYFYTKDELSFVVWRNKDYIYYVGGIIQKNELLKIAYSTK